MLPAAWRRISICLRGTRETLIYDDAEIAEAFVYVTLGVSLLSSLSPITELDHRQSLNEYFIWSYKRSYSSEHYRLIVSHCRSTKGSLMINDRTTNVCA